MIDQNVLDRFWEKVDIRGRDDCWEWIAGKSSDGYGTFTLNGKTEGAHRVSWTIENVKIPKGLLVCHHCDNRACVNPEHLFVGTDKDNIQDALRKGRMKFPRKSGEENGLSKLTEEQVLSIREEYKLGNITLGELARKHNVSHVAIWHVIKRKTWKHI